MGIFAVIVGGLGILSGASDTSIASSCYSTVSFLGLGAVILGVLGIVGGAVVNKNKKNGWWLNASLWATRVHSNLYALNFPGLLLIIGGILGFLTKNRNVMSVTN